MNNKWDRRFLELARVISTWSKDPSTQTGAVIVRTDKSVASVGFNGFPRSMEDRAEWLADRDEKYSRIIHCEINALIHAREPIFGYTLYTWPFCCCDRCVVIMLQAGVRRFVFPRATADQLSRWGPTLERALTYIRLESEATFTEYALEVPSSPEGVKDVRQ